MSLPPSPDAAPSALPTASLLHLPDAHVALLVAADPALVQFLIDLVESLGHAWVLAPTLEALYTRVAEGGYCYVIQSLDIHAKLGGKVQASAGETALTMFRKRYPQRNADDHHLLPIFVTAPSTADLAFAWRMHTLRVDELLLTPFADGGAAAMDKIRATLRLCGKDDHAECRPLVMARPAKARGGAEGAASATGSPAAPAPELSVVLDLDGTQRAGRTLIRIDGKPCWIQDFLFAVIAGLVAARLLDPDGWSTREKVGVGGLAEVAGKIHTEVRSLLPPGLRLLETAVPRLLRLAATTQVGALNWATLARHSEVEAKKLAKLRGRVRA